MSYVGIERDLWCDSPSVEDIAAACSWPTARSLRTIDSLARLPVEMQKREASKAMTPTPKGGSQAPRPSTRWMFMGAKAPGDSPWTHQGYKVIILSHVASWQGKQGSPPEGRSEGALTSHRTARYRSLCQTFPTPIVPSTDKVLVGL
jgi:hypothetical protein